MKNGRHMRIRFSMISTGRTEKRDTSRGSSGGGRCKRSDRKVYPHARRSRGASRAHPWFADKKESSWREKCRHWREKYPVVTEEKYKEPEPGRTNIYAFYDSLSKVLPEGEQILVSVGTSRVAGSQAIYLKKGQRFYTNAVTASMGYGLPAAIGVCVGSGKKEVICVNGEGCMQMNLQELQTIGTITCRSGSL